jgi:large subunit ribosomal protein L15e
MNYQAVAEQRAGKRYRNLEVLNSYWIGQDGIYYFYEVIMVDPTHPQIRNNSDMKWITNVKARAFRGLTSAGKKGRGYRFKGKRMMMKR